MYALRLELMLQHMYDFHEGNRVHTPIVVRCMLQNFTYTASSAFDVIHSIPYPLPPLTRPDRLCFDHCTLTTLWLSIESETESLNLNMAEKVSFTIGHRQPSQHCGFPGTLETATRKSANYSNSPVCRKLLEDRPGRPNAVWKIAVRTSSKSSSFWTQEHRLKP